VITKGQKEKQTSVWIGVGFDPVTELKPIRSRRVLERPPHPAPFFMTVFQVREKTMKYTILNSRRCQDWVSV
jgi:hypothetical protein